MSRLISTCRETAWCDTHALNSFSTAPYVGQAPRGTEERTRRYPWCISARLSPLSWRRTVSCSELEFPCSMGRPATRACPASTFARWQTCWGAPLSFLASSEATVTPRSHTASRTIGVLETHAAGPGQRQQALRGEHLDVALRQGPLPNGVYRGG